MRDFLDAIMQFISAATLSDEEFATASSLPDDPGEYTIEVYNVCLSIIDGRELVSGTREKLAHLFQAKGISINQEPVAKSNIFIGSPL